MFMILEAFLCGFLFPALLSSITGHSLLRGRH